MLKLILVLLFIISCLLHVNSNPSNLSNKKLKEISELATKSKGSVITLDDSTYSYYATSKPRSYSLIVFLTAAHPKFKCSICKQIDSEFSLLASSYVSQCNQNKEEQKIFFLRLDYESSQKVFSNYQINSVPFIFHVPAAAGAEAERVVDIAFMLPRNKYQIPSDPDAESLSNFVKDVTGVSITIQRSMLGMYIMLLVVFGILAALVRPIINRLPFFIGIIQYKPIWLMITMAVYICSISGIVFDILRNPPMYHANPQTGQILFFYPQSGSQFVVEGFVIGFLNVACAVGLIFITVFVPKFKSEQTRSTCLWLGMGVFLLCFFQIKGLYRMKNRWYGSSV